MGAQIVSMELAIQQQKEREWLWEEQCRRQGTYRVIQDPKNRGLLVAGPNIAPGTTIYPPLGGRVTDTLREIGLTPENTAYTPELHQFIKDIEGVRRQAEANEPCKPGVHTLKDFSECPPSVFDFSPGKFMAINPEYKAPKTSDIVKMAMECPPPPSCSPLVHSLELELRQHNKDLEDFKNRMAAANKARKIAEANDNILKGIREETKPKPVELPSPYYTEHWSKERYLWEDLTQFLKHSASIRHLGLWGWFSFRIQTWWGDLTAERKITEWAECTF